MFGFKIVTQFERGVVFRWGRALTGVREPGLTWVNPFTDRPRKVNAQIVAAAVPAQEAITRDNPAALQLRLLQTVVEVAAEKNSTLVMPVPVELLRFLDRTVQGAGPRRRATAGIGGVDGLPPAAQVPAPAVLPSLVASPARNAPLNAAPNTPATA